MLLTPGRSKPPVCRCTGLQDLFWGLSIDLVRCCATHARSQWHGKVTIKLVAGHASAGMYNASHAAKAWPLAALLRLAAWQA